MATVRRGLWWQSADSEMAMAHGRIYVVGMGTVCPCLPGEPLCPLRAPAACTHTRAAAQGPGAEARRRTRVSRSAHERKRTARPWPNASSPSSSPPPALPPGCLEAFWQAATGEAPLSDAVLQEQGLPAVRPADSESHTLSPCVQCFAALVAKLTKSLANLLETVAQTLDAPNPSSPPPPSAAHPHPCPKAEGSQHVSSSRGQKGAQRPQNRHAGSCVQAWVHRRGKKNSASPPPLRLSTPVSMTMCRFPAIQIEVKKGDGDYDWKDNIKLPREFKVGPADHEKSYFGFRVSGFGFRVWGSGFGPSTPWRAAAR